MPLADLLQALDRDAAQDLETTLAAQREQADDIVATAHTGAARLVEDSIATATQDAHRAASAVRAQAQAQARTATRATVDGALNDLRGEVEEALRRAAQSDGEMITLALVRESLDALPTATRVHVPPGFVDTVAETVARDWPDLEVLGDLQELGATVEDRSGRTLVNTVSMRLDMLWPTLAAPLIRSWEPRDREHPSGEHPGGGLPGGEQP